MTVREVMFLCMWCCCDALCHSFRIVTSASEVSDAEVHCSVCTMSEASDAQMLCTVTKVSAVSDYLDDVHLYCILCSFSFSDVMQFCHIVCSFRYSCVVCSAVCSFRCSDVLHNCQMLWYALLWQCLQFPNLLGYAHLPQRLESLMLLFHMLCCSVLLQCLSF